MKNERRWRCLVAALDIFEGRRRNLYTHQSSVIQQQSARTGFWLNVIVIDVVVFDEVKDNLFLRNLILRSTPQHTTIQHVDFYTIAMKSQ